MAQPGRQEEATTQQGRQEVSRRIGIETSYGKRVNGPGPAVRMISADIRAYWPPGVDEDGVITALAQAHEQDGPRNPASVPGRSAGGRKGG